MCLGLEVWNRVEMIERVLFILDLVVCSPQNKQRTAWLATTAIRPNLTFGFFRAIADRGHKSSLPAVAMLHRTRALGIAKKAAQIEPSICFRASVFFKPGMRTQATNKCTCRDFEKPSVSFHEYWRKDMCCPYFRFLLLPWWILVF